MRLSISSNPFGVVNCNENKSPQVVDLRIPLREPSPKRKAGLISPPCELANSSTTAAAAIVSERDPLSDSKQLHIEFIFLFGNNYFIFFQPLHSGSILAKHEDNGCAKHFWQHRRRRMGSNSNGTNKIRSAGWNTKKTIRENLLEISVHSVVNTHWQ